MKTCYENSSDLHIVILAAGNGVRMNSCVTKVLHKIGGKPMLAHVIQIAKTMPNNSIYVIHGKNGDEIREKLDIPNITWVKQDHQLGTGHAVLQAIPFIPSCGRVLVLYGDVPLISQETLSDLLNQTGYDEIGVLVTELDNPKGFGRILRNYEGDIEAIVEEKDASAEQRKICEINTGIMLLPAKLLIDYLHKVQPNNVQKEYYLTDVISLAVSDKHRIIAVKARSQEEVLGVNDRAQLAKLERCYQKRIVDKLLHQGVTFMDPSRFDLRGELKVGKDVVIDVNVIIQGKVEIGSNVEIGPNCLLRDVCIGNNVKIEANSVVERSIIDECCVIGPFARIRPESHLKKGAHIGNFTEIKKSVIGECSKVNHISYLGDAIVGKNVNVGAGTITCNYDGVNKHQTVIKDGAFIGSDTQLVAPVCIGENAYIGAGSTIISDAPADKLTLSRAKQVTIEDWDAGKKRKK